MPSADYSICTKVMERPEWKNADTICLYFSQSHEVDTKPLLAAALTDGKRIVFPRVEGKGLVLHEIRSITDFTKGKYNILEPKKSTPIVKPACVDIFIVPGVAFDRAGNRMGHGKGYYDRLLAECHAPKIGLSYERQVIAKLDSSSYDVPMTAVITEKGVYHAS